MSAIGFGPERLQAPHPATPTQLCSIKARETKRGRQRLLGLWDITTESQGQAGQRCCQ